MTNITVDFGKKKGAIRAMHAVGQPPRLGARNDFMHYLTDAHIPYTRLHDMGGGFGGFLYVDIPNLFRDFDADENDPASYDFAFTDDLLKAIYAAKSAPIFRLGVTIENWRGIKPYRIDPPKDFNKWARICEHVVRHYNEGWANGFTYGVRYWEIWNEPDGGADPNKSQMWTGTMTDYLDLYEITAKHLKACFGDTIAVGGFASCGFYDVVSHPERYGEDWVPTLDQDTVKANGLNDRPAYFVEFFAAFLDRVKKSGAPMDFFSWHSYASPKDTVKMADFVDRMLTKYGFGDVETQLNEWNPAHSVDNRGTSYSAAVDAEMMLRFQDKKTTILCFYDARIGQSVYGGLFNPLTYKPFCTYYPFVAFGEMYEAGTQVEAAVDTDALAAAKGSNITAVGAVNADGSEKFLLIANTGVDEEVHTNFSGAKVYQIDEAHLMTEVELDPERFIMPKNTVIYLKWKAEA